MTVRTVERGKFSWFTSNSESIFSFAIHFICWSNSFSYLVKNRKSMKLNWEGRYTKKLQSNILSFVQTFVFRKGKCHFSDFRYICGHRLWVWLAMIELLSMCINTMENIDSWRVTRLSSWITLTLYIWKTIKWTSCQPISKSAEKIPVRNFPLLDMVYILSSI